jgi:hypothetical protein
MNVNVCYDRYGKKSSIETGSTNKNLRTNPKTSNNSDKNNEKESIGHSLRPSPVKGHAVRSKSDLNISTLKHSNRGASNNEMAVIRSRSNSGTKTLSHTSTTNPLLSSKPKANIRSKSDLWGVKRSSKPTMATVVESDVSNGTKSQRTNIPPSNTNTTNNDNLNSKLSKNTSRLKIDTKPSRIPVSPSFQRKLRVNTATGNTSNSSWESKRKLQLTTSKSTACEKPINRTQSSYMMENKPDQKQSSYGQNKERS